MLIRAATAAPADSIEYEIKATYLYKFVPFVEWPQSAVAAPAFNLCIVGDDPVAAAIDQAAKGQTVAGKPLVVKHLPTAAPDAGCHVMYLAGTDAQTVAQALAAMKGAPVLTVTDEASHPNDRGIISFVIDANHVRFDIDDAAAAQDGLVISSKLLGLAHSVKSPGPGAHGG
jgi:YfiR/HmsC-like